MKKCVVIYTEGETDEEFYNMVLDTIKLKLPDKKFNADVIEKSCIKGIAKFQKKLVNKFAKEIVKKYGKDHDITVFLCYDTDVFEFGVQPPVDRNALEKDLRNAGAKEVVHIKANRTIEDFFMYDLDGIIDFLNIKKPKRITGSAGLQKLEFLFSKANKIYQKGYKCQGFIASLDMQLIFSHICSEIKPLCIELGLPENCSNCK